MIYYITMHHNTDAFVQLQAYHTDVFTDEDYKVYCGLSGIKSTADATRPPFSTGAPPFEHYELIDITDVENQHTFRMNYLFNLMQERETFSPDDLLVFMDGDAFPIAYWPATIRSLLETHEVVAVERREDIEPLMEDKYKPYPHPLFFATKVKFWQENELKWELKFHPDWETDHTVINPCPCGGPLLKEWLDTNNYTVAPLLRSNVFNIHPLYFGVYGDLIYHHGAASGVGMVYGSSDIWTRPELAEKYGPHIDIAHPQIPHFNGALSELVWRSIIEMPHFINSYFLGKEAPYLEILDIGKGSPS